MKLARNARERRGYTMIEVIMGLAVLAVGASGVIALQKVTVLGVTEGRNLTAASAVAAHHLEAVRTDAVRWTSQATAGDATLLAALLAAGGNWTLVSNEAGFTNDDLGTADVTGLTGSAAPIAYCTHLRASVLAFDAGGVDPALVRVEARSFWAKSGRAVATECDDPDMMTLGLGGAAIDTSYTADDYGWVFLSTSIRRNDLP